MGPGKAKPKGSILGAAAGPVKPRGTALARRTGLRLFDFKCAWFDENHYFEFYPLHVVFKQPERLGRTVSSHRE